jgi:uncharacterized protein (TIGR02145 family)
MSAMSFAQTPEKMSYQAVFRNMYDRLITEQPVAVQISILQGSAEGTVVFQETQTVTTNADGIATFEIGGGTAVVGTLKDINWAEGPYFLKAEMDPEGGEDFTVNGAVELVAVPYAFYANASAGEFSGKYEDLTGAPEIPVVPTNISELENTSGFMDKEAQQLVKTGNTLTLTDATNIVELPAFNVFESDPTKNVVNRPEGVKAGELMYWDAEAGTWKTVAPGVAGYVLRMGEDGVPVWQRRPGTKTKPDVKLIAGEEYSFTATVADNGGSDVTARGFKYANETGVANNASATDVVIADGDDFATVIPATGYEVSYYVVAYATNENGTTYSDEFSFTTPPFICGESKLYDIDNNEYKTVLIGTQCWMAENMRAKHYADGTALQEWTVALKNSPQNNRIYAEVTENEVTHMGYQVYYTWPTAVNLSTGNTDQTKKIQGICPDGWHVPSPNEFAEMCETIDPTWKRYNGTWAGSYNQYSGTTHLSENKLAIKLGSSEGHWVAHSGPGLGAEVAYNASANSGNGNYWKDSPGYITLFNNGEDDNWNASGFNAIPTGYINKGASSGNAAANWYFNATLQLWTSVAQNAGTSGKPNCIKITGYEQGARLYTHSDENKSCYSVRCVSDEIFE